MFFSALLLRWQARQKGGRISSSAIIRGGENIKFGRACRIARHVELNASSGSMQLGEGVTVGPFTLLETRGGNIKIGDRSAIGPLCALYGQGGLEIGADCMIASHVVCIPENHNYARTDLPMRLQGGHQRGIRIGDDVWLATRVTVLDGVTIGNGAVIGAGAVVTHDIPSYAIAYGVPAKVVGYRGQARR